MKTKDRAVGRNVSDSDTHQGFMSGKQAKLQRGVGGVAHQGLLL